MMAYTPIDIYRYIIEEGREADFLNAMRMHKGNFSIGEITDRKYVMKNGEYYIVSDAYHLNFRMEDERILQGLRDGLYVSTFISRKGDQTSLHFLIHKYPVSEKEQYDEQILQEVIQYMIVRTIITLRLDTPQKADDYADLDTGIQA